MLQFHVVTALPAPSKVGRPGTKWVRSLVIKLKVTPLSFKNAWDFTAYTNIHLVSKTVVRLTCSASQFSMLALLKDACYVYSHNVTCLQYIYRWLSMTHAYRQQSWWLKKIRVLKIMKNLLILSQNQNLCLLWRVSFLTCVTRLAVYKG